MIGADGRGSTTAERVGAAQPYRGSRNGRGLAFFYCDDPQVGTPWRGRVIQLRAGTTHTLVFPCPEDRMLVLFMGPAEEIPLFRKDPDAMLGRMLAENPAAAERVGDAPNRTKLRSTGSVSAFFRRSSGPGWALTGDAGHFKDPVIGQGMRDAMRYGRLLGEAAGPVLDDPVRLDRALLEAEKLRDRECLAAYHWGNRESRIMPVTPLLQETLRTFKRSGASELMDMFDRVRAPHHVLNPVRGASLAPAHRRPSRHRPPRAAARAARGAADRRRRLARGADAPVPADARLGLGASGLRGPRRRAAHGAPRAGGCERQRSSGCARAGRHRRRTATAGDARAGREPHQMSDEARRVVAVQLAVRLGEVERNLEHIADVVGQAAREHHPDMIFLPEVSTTPNLAHRAMRGCVRPVDGGPLALYRSLAREYGCTIGAGRADDPRPRRAQHLLRLRARRRRPPARQGPAVDVGERLLRPGRDEGVMELADGPIGCANGFEWARAAAPPRGCAGACGCWRAGCASRRSRRGRSRGAGSGGATTARCSTSHASRPAAWRACSACPPCIPRTSATSSWRRR